MKVQRNTLLLLACFVWSTAGTNILRIGIMSYSAHSTVLNYLLSILVFAVFQIFIFGKLVKNTPLESIIMTRRAISFSSSLIKKPSQSWRWWSQQNFISSKNTIKELAFLITVIVLYIHNINIQLEWL